MIPLVQILRDFIHSESTEAFECDWLELFSLAKKHEVTAIVYHQCKQFIPNQIRAQVEHTYNSNIFYYTNREWILQQIEQMLENMDYFVVKGAMIAKFYPIPAFRTMGDTDIVIKTKDRELVDKKFREFGFISKSKFDNREWQYYYHTMEFELHDHLVYKEIINKPEWEDYFNNFWQYVTGHELDWNFHFLFLIFHLLKHFMNGGIGFRYFMDIAVLCSRGPNFDWNWIEEKLNSLGMWAFAEKVFALNQYWFGVQTPLKIQMPDTAFLNSATSLIEKNGIFGFHNEDNDRALAANKVRGRKNRKILMVKNAISSLFPGYQSLVVVPHFHYLKKRAYLLPFAWLHRCVRGIRNRHVEQGLKSIIDHSIVNNDVVIKREELYKQWGL